MALMWRPPRTAEAKVLGGGGAGANVLHVGVGPRKAGRAGPLGAGSDAAGVAVAGFCGSLSDELAPGDVVVASEVRSRDGGALARCPGAGIVAGMLRRRGLRAHVGPIVSVHNPAFGRARVTLHRSSAA